MLLCICGGILEVIVGIVVVIFLFILSLFGVNVKIKKCCNHKCKEDK